MSTDTLTPARTTAPRARRGFDRAAGEGALAGVLTGAALGTWFVPLSGIALALYGAVAGAALGSLAGLVVHAFARRSRGASPEEHRPDGSRAADLPDHAARSSATRRATRRRSPST